MMKASIGRLKRFAFHKVDGKDKGELFPTAQIDELARAVKDMQDMRECYDKLLSAAAATANSAYEFSESLGEMGSCLEKIALHNDEESGKILSMLGRVQFELRRLVDTYRAHIFKTITHPSESLLNELRTVEDMKRQCDEKRDAYEYMMGHVKEKERPKCKGENSMSHQLQAAHNEFHDEATLCIFRLKSLKQGQSHSLLTQAARHHSSQMRLFRDGLQSLEAVEKHVRIAAEKQHIDCELSEMEDTNNDGDDDPYINKDGELSFDCRTSTQRIEALSTPRNSIKEDADLLFPRPSATEPAVMHRDKKEHQVSSHDNKASSHSAPLFLEKRCDFSDRLRQMNPSPAQAGTNAYVLPTPAFTTKPAPSNVKPTSYSGNTWQWHSSPLEQVKNGKDSENSSSISTRLPRPSSGEPHQFSVPLMSKPFSGGAVSRLPVRSPKVSPVGSPPPPPPPPPLGSSPQVSELHELPRPPGTVRRTKFPGGLVGHSAPVSAWSGSHERSTVPSSTGIAVGSPLPVPPLVVVPRSFSIPTRDQRAVGLMNHRSPPTSLPRAP